MIFFIFNIIVQISIVRLNRHFGVPFSMIKNNTDLSLIEFNLATARIEVGRR